MLDLFAAQSSSANPTLIAVLYTSVLAFILSTLIAWTYEKTFKGLSYSRNFIQSMILSSLVAATIMQSIGDSVGRGLGMLGALAIVRFRTNFKDSRDIIFLFSALGAGIGCGVYAYGVALTGTIFFCVVALILAKTHFGNSTMYDGMLRLVIDSQTHNSSSQEAVFKKHLKYFALVTLREAAQGNRLDCAYQIKLRNQESAGELMKELNQTPGISGLNLMLQESTTEL